MICWFVFFAQQAGSIKLYICISEYFVHINHASEIALQLLDVGKEMVYGLAVADGERKAVN